MKMSSLSTEKKGGVCVVFFCHSCFLARFPGENINVAVNVWCISSTRGVYSWEMCDKKKAGGYHLRSWRFECWGRRDNEYFLLTRVVNGKCAQILRLPRKDPKWRLIVLWCKIGNQHLPLEGGPKSSLRTAILAYIFPRFPPSISLNIWIPFFWVFSCDWSPVGSYTRPPRCQLDFTVLQGYLQKWSRWSTSHNSRDALFLQPGWIGFFWGLRYVIRS